MIECIRPFTDPYDNVVHVGTDVGGYDPDYVAKLIRLGFAADDYSEPTDDACEAPAHDDGEAVAAAGEEGRGDAACENQADALPADIEEMSPAQLRDLAELRGIVVKKGWNKSALIKALKG